MTPTEQDNELQFCESCNGMTRGNPTCGKCGAWRETEAMTPTQQDKELRTQIRNTLYNHEIGFSLAKADRQTPGQMVEELIDAMLCLVTADRKRVAMEARLDERQMLNFHRAYGRDYQETLETLEEANDERIALINNKRKELL